MFSHVGWSELIVLGVVGLVIFGPDRLPKAAQDAARLLRQVRSMARGAAADLKAELGPEIADLELASLHPRRLVASVFDDEPAPVDRPAPMAPVTGGPTPYDADAT